MQILFLFFNWYETVHIYEINVIFCLRHILSDKQMEIISTSINWNFYSFILPSFPFIPRDWSHSILFLILRQGFLKSLNCQCWAWIYGLPASASQSTEVTGIYHCSWLTFIISLWWIHSKSSNNFKIYNKYHIKCNKPDTQNKYHIYMYMCICVCVFRI